jgi:hypothetical protein
MKIAKKGPAPTLTQSSTVLPHLLLAAYAIAIAVGFFWGLPASDSWAADSISPRSCGLGAIAETYRPGHFHTYPPLHMVCLTLLSAPWVALAACRVGWARLHMDTLTDELIKPAYMTPIEIGSRLVTAAMAMAIVWNTMRLWFRLGGRSVGIGAGIILSTNATLLYYAHTGNLEVPYLFWLTWAFVEMDRVMCGEPRERQCVLLATAAVLTKDQAAAALILSVPFCLVYVPWALLRAPVLRVRLLHAVPIGLAAYAVLSGVVVNPTGFVRRVRFLFGPASQTWSAYPYGLRGGLALLRASVAAVPHFTSWAIAAMAVCGIGLALAARQEVARARILAPLVAALSFELFFSLNARRSEDRFLLPQAIMLLPYAALAFDRAWRYWSPARPALVLAWVAATVPAILGVASMDATLLADPRYAAERFLAALPFGSRIEVYGGPHFLPRVPRQAVAIRPGVEPIADRQPISGIADLVDPALDPRPRSPAAIVLATEFSSEDAGAQEGVRPYGLMSYRDPTSRAFFRALFDGSLGYTRVFRARCVLPWPLECRNVHDSTAREVWIYEAGPRDGA